MNAECPSALAEAQERLREREQLYRNIIDLSGLTPWTADVDGKVVTIGSRWTEWTGDNRADAMGDGWLGWLHPDDRGEIKRAWQQAVASAHSFEAEYRVRFRDGSYRWCHAQTKRQANPRSGDAVWYGTLHDCHDRRLDGEAFRRTQEELIHVSRLSAMGAMASAIAHEINQPLTAIRNYVRGSKRLLPGLNGPGKQDVAHALNEAEASIVRAGEIVQRVREFVHRGAVDHRREDLGRLVEEGFKFSLVDASVREISYCLDLTANCTVMADRIQIQQVLVNLIRNAVEAMEGQASKKLLIRTRQCGKFCEVSVKDSGPGLAVEAADRMFDPFYTTRADGMGIGLSISRMIVESHGGTIWGATAPGEGTTITFSIPVIPPA